MNNRKRTQLAQETVAILKSGNYTSAQGSGVDISGALESSVKSTRLIRPDEWDSLIATVRSCRKADGVGRIEVTPETTLAAIRRLVVSERYVGVAALNFASAKNPGGGFLGGSQAQEESLARSSGLYASLLTQNLYYQANRACDTLLYTHHAILSPLVPIFRDDDGTLTESPYHATFITMPASNVGAMQPGSADIERVAEVMEYRMNCAFALTASTDIRHFVLGAWGCGVFRNDPDLIARLFVKCLSGANSWRPFFDQIVFAVFDPSPDSRNRRPFEHHLSLIE